MKVTELIQMMIGQRVYVEGTHAIVLPAEDAVGGATLKVLYSPVTGELKQVLEDGFVLAPDTGGPTQVYVLSNVRSIALLDDKKARSSGLMI